MISTAGVPASAAANSDGLPPRSITRFAVLLARRIKKSTMPIRQTHASATPIQITTGSSHQGGGARRRQKADIAHQKT